MVAQAGYSSREQLYLQGGMEIRIVLPTFSLFLDFSAEQRIATVKSFLVCSVLSFNPNIYIALLLYYAAENIEHY